MEHNGTVRKWSELKKLPVFVPTEKRNLGTVEDFYFKGGTNAIYALRVGTRVDGEWALPITGIVEVGSDHVAIINGQMMTRALPPLPQAEDLTGKKVMSESGDEVGIVGEIYLATDTPVALRITGIELASSAKRRSGRARAFSAADIVDYVDDTVIIYDHAARRL